MEQTEHYRHEIKYDITYLDYLALRQRIRTVMKQDSHVRADGTYLIRSIYFDNVADKALYEKREGVAVREKFRIRYYNDDLSFFMLEKKVKDHYLCRKESAPLNYGECCKILKGDFRGIAAREEPLLQEFYLKCTQQLLKPRVQVSYIREPYLYAPGNVRVTFDRGVRSSMNHRDFLERQWQDIQVIEQPSRMILEVKYDEYLPDVIRMLLQMEDVRQRSYSKYGECRKFG